MPIYRENVEVYDDNGKKRIVKLTLKCPEEAVEGLNLPWLTQLAYDKGGVVVIEIRVEKLKR